MRKTGFMLGLLICAAAGALFSQALVINYRVDTQADSSRPVVSVLFDTTAAGGDSLIVHRWPDSTRIKLLGFNWTVLELTPIRPFIRDSVETLEGYRTIWWSGAHTTLGDSTAPALIYKIEGDSLLPR